MSSKPRPIFNEMPWNIKQDIIDSTDFKTRCVLRKCSKALRYQVNNSHATLLPIEFILDDNMVQVRITKIGDKDDVVMEVDYRLKDDGCSVNGKFIRGENYMDRSVADFAAVARHPRTEVQWVSARDSDSFELEERRMRADDKIRFIRAFEKEFTYFSLKTRHLQLFLKLSQQDQMRMLALTCPGVLKCIELEPIDEYQDTSEIIASEHWERAKSVLMGLFRNLPAQSLTRFPRWSAPWIKITLEDAKVFVEKILEFGESFEEWDIWYGELERDAIIYFISEFVYQEKEEKHYLFKKIPGTMYHLKFEIQTEQNAPGMSFCKYPSSLITVVD